MRKFGLIGFPLSHSFSQKYFTEKFRDEQIPDCVYENFPLENINELSTLLQDNTDIAGLNVTIPYKEKVLSFLTHKNEVVEKIRACNCIKIDQEKLFGFNTDVTGFRNSFEPLLKPYHTGALILGQGGAAKAASFVLDQLNIPYLFVVRKSESPGQKILWEQVTESIISNQKIIINCTPIGMYPEAVKCPPLPYEALTAEHYLFDTIYNPPETLFLKKGRAKGATIKNGLEMLVIQAEESWRIWNT